MSRVLCLSLLLIMAWSAVPTAARADELADLRRENEELRQQVRSLSLELIALREEVSRLKAAQPVADGVEVEAAASEPDDTPTDEVVEAEQADGERKQTVRTIGYMFQGLPRELLPKAKEGWDRFDWPKVEQWFSGEWVGHPLDLRVTLASAPAVQPVREPVDEKQGWRVQYQFAWPSTEYMGLPIRSSVRFVSVAEGFSTVQLNPVAIALLTSEARAREEARRREGAPLRLRGTIRSAQLTSFNGRYTVTIELEGASVHFQ